MKPLTAILAGATGLVGGECLRRLLASPRYERVIVVTRRKLTDVVADRKLRQVVTEFENLGEVREVQVLPSGDHVVCLSDGKQVPLTRGLREFQERLQTPRLARRSLSPV